MGSSPGPEAANNNELLAIIIRCTNEFFHDPDAHPGAPGKWIEYCSIETTEDITTVGATNSRWKFGVLRARLGWPARQFETTDPTHPVEVWIVRRADLPAWQNRVFVLTSEFAWKLVPFNAYVARDPTEVNPVSPPWRIWSFGAPSFAPVIGFLAPTPTDNAALTAGTEYTANIQVTDRDGNLSRVEVLFFKVGDPEPTPLVKVLGSVGPEYLWDPPFKFTPTNAGSYRLEVRAIDTVDFLQVTGRNYTVTTGVESAVKSPFLFKTYDSVGAAAAIEIRPATPGAESYYSAVPIGSPAGAFTKFVSPFFVITQNRSIYVYGHMADLSKTDSPTVRYNIYLNYGGSTLGAGSYIP